MLNQICSIKGKKEMEKKLGQKRLHWNDRFFFFFFLLKNDLIFRKGVAGYHVKRSLSRKIRLARKARPVTEKELSVNQKLP